MIPSSSAVLYIEDSLTDDRYDMRDLLTGDGQRRRKAHDVFVRRLG